MSTTAWIVLGVLGWIVLATGLALFLGRLIRLRDRPPPVAADRLRDRPPPPAEGAPPEAANGDADVAFRDRRYRD